MIKVENIEVCNIEGALRGMRNPMNSWHRSDSYWDLQEDKTPINPNDEMFFDIGENDKKLMRELFKGGTEHRKYLRQIFVCMDITAPLYWWAEMDTYKVGITRNSCSFMHKGVSKPFEISDFSRHEQQHINNPLLYNAWKNIIDALNKLRDDYIDTSSNSGIEVFQQIRCLLPCGYNQRATITMNYENVFNILKQRSFHRLDEWREFCQILRTELPYVGEMEKWMYGK